MIELQKIDYRYRDGKVALAGVSLEIREGEILGIVGENGSGKSTLGLVIAGLYRPKKGKITLDGVEYRKIDKKELRRAIGIVLQNPDMQIIFADVEEDMVFALKNLKISEDEWGTRVDESLRATGMGDFLHANPYNLSYGQKQRIVIAGVLALRTRYVVFDEPTSMMDEKHRKMFYGMMSRLKQQGIGVVLITNNGQELKYADRVVKMKNGRVDHD